jgi:hypothetical protein
MVDCPIQRISWTPLLSVMIFSPTYNSSIGFNAPGDSVMRAPFTSDTHVIWAKRFSAFSRSTPTKVY